MTNQMPPPPGFWAKQSPMGRVGIMVAVLVLFCGGGAALIGALSGGDKPVDAALVGQPGATVEQAGDQPSGQPSDQPSDQPSAEATPTAFSEVPATAPPTSSTVAITTKRVTERKAIAFTTRTVKDSGLAKGKTEVRTKGVAGVRTITYQVTMTDGKETSRKQVSSVVTKKPVTKVVAQGTKAAAGGNCDPNYSGCVPIASDVDCAGGSGNGPAYVSGPIRVTGSDIYKLDNDGDGVACDS